MAEQVVVCPRNLGPKISGTALEGVQGTLCQDDFPVNLLELERGQACPA